MLDFTDDDTLARRVSLVLMVGVLLCIAVSGCGLSEVPASTATACQCGVTGECSCAAEACVCEGCPVHLAAGCNCFITGDCDCGDDCTCSKCVKHLDAAEVKELVDDLYWTAKGLRATALDDVGIRYATMMFRAYHVIRASRGEQVAAAEYIDPLPPPGLLTRDDVLSTGRQPRGLYFTTPGCQPCAVIEANEFPVLRSYGYTIGESPDSVIQQMPDDTDLHREFGVSVYPTFLRIENGRVTHRINPDNTPIIDWRTLHNLCHGRQMFGMLQEPGWNPFYRLPAQRFYAQGGGC